MMSFKLILLLFLINYHVDICKCANISTFYDAFRGTPLSKEELLKYEKANNTESCAIKMKRCEWNEGRRIDNSCNNKRYVSRGPARTPLLRLLPALFHNVTEPRLAESGEPLPLCRVLRTNLLLVGHHISPIFTQLVPYFFVFMTVDVTSLGDTIDYVLYKTYCCEPRGKLDDACIPMKIPRHDPVHRFSGHRCMNQTRPKTFQSAGCLRKRTTPERELFATIHFDMSSVYGSDIKLLLEKGRKFEGGLLRFEIDKDKLWPPSLKDPYSECILNQKPTETRCHDTPDATSNTLVGLNLLTVWFWRNHNKIANELAQINPCWSDNKLFDTARDINIATVLQIFYYEFLPALMGRDNLIQDEVIMFGDGHRDVYDENIVPQVTSEFVYILRYLHIMQDATLKEYDADGNYLKQVHMVNLTLRAGYVTNNIASITKGSHLQPCAKAGRVVHPDMADYAFGPLQQTIDVFAADICKGRYYGLGTYVQYRTFCTGKIYSSFEDLKDVIDDKNIELLQQSYNSVNDIELMAGLWLERPMEGGHLPSTFYCLAIDQLKRNVRSDRHWYERANRPKAFNLRQLLEIRKATFAKVLCDVGDSLFNIQPDAFKRPGFGNRIKSCEDIEGINLIAWKDLSCSSRY